MAISNQQLYDLMMRVYQRQERLSFDEVVPSSVSVVAGTLVTGDAASLAQRDKTYLQVSEVVADPGLRVDITFSSTAGAVPHAVSLIGRYEGGPTHHMDVLAYNVNTLGWDDLSAVETLEMLNQSADDILYEYHLSPEHIAGDGTVIIRLDHDPTNGTQTGHNLYLDKATLSVLGGEHQTIPADVWAHIIESKIASDFFIDVRNAAVSAAYAGVAQNFIGLNGWDVAEPYSITADFVIPDGSYIEFYGVNWDNITKTGSGDNVIAYPGIGQLTTVLLGTLGSGGFVPDAQWISEGEAYGDCIEMKWRTSGGPIPAGTIAMSVTDRMGVVRNIDIAFPGTNRNMNKMVVARNGTVWRNPNFQYTALDMDPAPTGGGGGGNIIIPPLAGTVTQTYALSAQSITMVRGDSARLTFNLGANRQGWSAKFSMRIKDTGRYLVSGKSCVWISEAQGTGYVDITAAENASIGTMEGEIELSNGSQRHTALKVTMRVIDDVVK